VKPHPRIRKTVKWGGAVVCVAMVIVWIGSAWWWVTWWNKSGTILSIVGGRVEASEIKYSNPGVQNPGLHVQRIPRIFFWWFQWKDSSAEWVALLPIWPLILLLAAMSVAAWHLDRLARRRARVGHCPTCNYDRLGLPGASPCPECGAVAAVPAPTKT
jgi:hypothetical protein